MIMRVGPDIGKEKLIPKRKKLKFRVAKAAKDAILGDRNKGAGARSGQTPT